MGTSFFKRSYFIVLGVLSFATTEHFNDSATLLKQPIHSFGCLRFIWNIVTNASHTCMILATACISLVQSRLITVVQLSI